MTANPIKLVVLVSDIHCGSTTGLLPPGFKNFEANEIKQNPVQEWLWEAWTRGQDWVAGVVGSDPFALVINGDSIEGVHHGTKQVVSPQVGDHAAAAKIAVMPLARRAARRFVVRGTECHTGEHEIALGDDIGAEINPDLGLPIFDRLTVDVNGTRCVFRHHISASVRRNLAGSGLSIALAEEQVESANNEEPLTRVLCCAHRHKFGVYKDDNGVCVVTPPWQFLTRFGHKVVSPARCKPGFVVLDWRGEAEGALPHVHSKIYKTPPPKAFTL